MKCIAYLSNNLSNENMRKFSIVLLVFICHIGCVSCADDLDLFIDGEIGFEEIQDYINEDVSVQDAVMDAYKMKASESKANHDLCEKLCYASVLYNMVFFPPHALYAIYLTARNNCSPHKLDWDRLLEKIKKELKMTGEDVEHGKCIYEDYQERGGRGYVLPPDDGDDY